jgi:cytidylate kinase
MSYRRSIAIDGPAGSGKSTVARGLARMLGYRYVSTGDIYRALALATLRKGVDPTDEQEVERLALESRIELHETADGGQRTFLNGEDVSDAIRRADVDGVVSPVSVHPRVRAWLIGLQRSLANERDIVMDGRDIGTVVLPESEHKFFLTASPEERARRRHKEYEAKGRAVSFDEVLQGVLSRDAIDSGRATAPLVVAPGAVVIDCTNMSVAQVIGEMLRALGRTGN